MFDFEEDNKTIFSGDLDHEEKAAVKSGEKRGEREAERENPERFGLAGQRAKGRRKYDEGYRKAFGHE